MCTQLDKKNSVLDKWQEIIKGVVDAEAKVAFQLIFGA